MADLTPLVGIGGTLFGVPPACVALWRYVLRTTLDENRALKAELKASAADLKMSAADFDAERKLRLAAELAEARATAKLEAEQERGRR